MNMQPSTRATNETESRQPVPVPEHNVHDLLKGGQRADILLGDQRYLLRITRAGKLILTK